MERDLEYFSSYFEVNLTQIKKKILNLYASVSAKATKLCLFSRATATEAVLLKLQPPSKRTVTSTFSAALTFSKVLK